MDNKGQNIFLSVVGFATLLVSIIGATFAYFTVQIAGNNTASSIDVAAADVAAVTFADGPAISVSNAYPGYSNTKTFTISSTDGDANSSVQYVINLVTTLTTLSASSPAANTGEVYYSLSGNASGSGTASAPVTKANAPKTNTTTQIGSGTLVGNESHTYTFTFGITERNSEQDYLQGMKFKGIIQIAIVSTDGLRTWDETTSNWKKWSSS